MHFLSRSDEDLCPTKVDGVFLTKQEKPVIYTESRLHYGIIEHRGSTLETHSILKE